MDAALALDARRRELLGESDGLKAERNAVSKKIGEAIRAGAKPDGPEVDAYRRKSVEWGAEIEKLDAELAATETQLEDLLLRIPNPADPDVPVGDASANKVVRTWGQELPHITKGPDGVAWERRPHWDVAESLRMIDLERGAKITGSGFPDLHRRGLAPAAGPDRLHARRPHRRARHDGDLAAGPGQRRLGPRHRADPGQGRPDVRGAARRAVSRAHGGGPGHQHRTATRSSRRTSCRSATSPTRPASAARPARPARTPAASCASTSSTRSRWSSSRSPKPPAKRSNG